ncbi:MAG: low molecular weight protein-tyrosine-phosphatase [Candidatus Competibacterales bacterium]|nr:low molecular weight protein-tyrosine-phosphatase [Candidatus Competibacterales bacterium]
MIRVLMVCTGNICRSPMAEGLLRSRLERAGLAGRVAVDSAGTTDYHSGEPPDRRAQQAARARGVEIADQRARRVTAADLDRFDYLLTMDESHVQYLHRLATDDAQRARIQPLMSFAPDWPVREVPDPYYGGSRGFAQVMDMLEAAVEGLLARLREQLPD